MNRPPSVPLAWRLARLGGDLAAAVAAFYLAFLARIELPIPFTQYLLPFDRIRFFASEWWVVAVSQLVVLQLFGFYDPPRMPAGTEQTRRLLAATSIQGLALMGYYFLTNRSFPRSVLLIFVALNFVLLALWRAAIRRFYRAPPRRVAIVGGGPAARELAAKIASLSPHGLALAGHVPTPEEPGEEADGPTLGPCLGDLVDLPRLLSEGIVDDVILASSAPTWQTRLVDGLAGIRRPHGNVLLLPGPIESLIGRMRYRWVEDLPLIEVMRTSEWRIDLPVKRLVDVAGAALLLLAGLPLMAVCGVAILAASPGSILYRQTRIGRGRRPFTLWKFRTMRPDAEQGTGEVLAERGDPRLIPGGAVLRRFRLDELPQLFNVLAGSMSLVGPRPERPGFVERYLAEVPGYAGRFSVTPGLTGLAQINGEYHSSAENKLRYDLAYISNWSPWLDFAILARTVKIVLTSRGV